MARISKQERIQTEAWCQTTFFEGELENLKSENFQLIDKIKTMEE
jgi:hypothetical protein